MADQSAVDPIPEAGGECRVTQMIFTLVFGEIKSDRT